MMLFDKLENHLSQKLPFVLYAKPNSKKINGLFQKNDTLYIADKKNDIGFVINSFENDILYLIPENNAEVIVDFFDSDNREKNIAFSIFEEEKNKINYTNLVASGIEAIKNNEFEKLVLSRKQQINFESINIIKTFKNLLIVFPDSFRYVFYHPKKGLWCGAFSEQFLKVDGLKFETMALAGTQKYNDVEKIEWKQKELSEQQFVTEYITEMLKSEVAEIVVSEPKTIRHGSLCHIKTDIFGQFKNDFELESIIKTLNPTPAVCGIPKELAKKFILENENYEREFYSGIIGEFNKDFETNEINKSHLFVNLRCMKVSEKYAELFVGAGITKDSEPEKEWEETVNKTQAMKNCLA